jgi:tetratricopeptide (TPR) repeat protein
MLARLLTARPKSVYTIRALRTIPLRIFSNQAADARGVTEEDVDVPPEDFKRMKESLSKFSQCMMLGKYSAAQMVLTAHREDIERFFSRDHPAFLSVENNQALLFKMNGNAQEAALIFERVIEKYTLYYGEDHPSTVNSVLNYANVLKDLKEYRKSVE